MNVSEMVLFARSIIRDQQILDAHFLRWLNIAYRQISRDYIVPRLNYGSPIDLPIVEDSTQDFYLPYDFSAVIAFQDQNNRTLDPIPSLDVAQYGEYNSFGSFVAFYEYTSVNVTALVSSGVVPNTIAIANRSTTVTCTANVFTDEHVGEFILPINRNETAGASNPEDYAYRIASTAGTVGSPSTTCEIERPFRGAISDAGIVGDIDTNYFEIRPANTPIVRIWGDPGDSDTISLTYQRKPSKLANPEDVPEDERISEALVYMAIDLAGWAYQNGFHAKKAQVAIAQALGQFQSVKDRDKELVRNFLTSNPNNRSYSQLGGIHMGNMDRYSGASGDIRY